MFTLESLILLHLRNHPEASQREIATALGKSPDRVRRALKLAVQRGKLEIVRQGGWVDDVNVTTQYALTPGQRIMFCDYAECQCNQCFTT